MTISDSYNQWARTYDVDRNLTRDLDFCVTRKLIGTDRVAVVIEAGCGTGKNTAHFSAMADTVFALDFSEGMLDLAKRHVSAPNVRFELANLTMDWPVPLHVADLVSFNLVLEHVADLTAVLGRAAKSLMPGGRVLISELHPCKQLQGSQARFVDEGGDTIRIPAFTHHVSEYFTAARACGLIVERVDEWWHDDDDPAGAPRLVTLFLRK